MLYQSLQYSMVSAGSAIVKVKKPCHLVLLAQRSREASSMRLVDWSNNLHILFCLNSA